MTSNLSAAPNLILSSPPPSSFRNPGTLAYPLSLYTMVQGKTKGLTTKTAGSSRHSAKAAANTKKGKREIAPKKPLLMKQAAMHKVCCFALALAPTRSDRLCTIWNGIGSNCEDQQVHRTPDGCSGFVWKTYADEKHDARRGVRACIFLRKSGADVPVICTQKLV